MKKKIHTQGNVTIIRNLNKKNQTFWNRIAKIIFFNNITQ